MAATAHDAAGPVVTATAQSEHQLYAMFPEIPRERVKYVVAQTRGDYDQVAYRLLTLELSGREFDGIPSTLPLNQDVKRSMITGSPGPGQSPRTSAAESARVAGFSSSRPPSVGAGRTPGAVNSPRDVGGSPYTPADGRGTDSYSDRRLLPSCDWCGKQFTNAELMDHLHIEHADSQAEYEHLRKDMATIRQSADARRIQQEGDAGARQWGLDIVDVVVPHLEDADSYASRLVTLECLEVLFRKTNRNAVVYLFGSSVTGLGTLDSDSDTAVSVHGDGLMRLERAEEQQVLEDFFQTIFSTNEGLIPGNEHSPRLGIRCDTIVNAAGKVEHIGVQKILRTRVPIVGNNPLYPEGAKGMDERRHMLALSMKDSKRVIQYTFPDVDAAQLQDDYVAKREIVQRAAERAGVEPHEIAASRNKIVLITVKSEADAVAFLAEEPRAQPRPSNPLPLIASTRWDASIRLYGVRNSHLIREYLSQPATRLAAVAVKWWSKKHRINDPRAGWLSSYAIALMFVHFLIRKKLHKFIPPDDIHLQDCSPRPAFIEYRPPKEMDKFATRVGRMFLDFINFYAFEYKWDTEVITVQSDSVVLKSTLGWTDQNAIRVDRGNSVHYHLCIEDPYEDADPDPWGNPRPGRLNVTRKITHYRSLLIHKKFVQTHNHLREKGAVSMIF